MPNNEDSSIIAREILGLQRDYSTARREALDTSQRSQRSGLWPRFLGHEWSSAVLCLFLDVVIWLGVYRIAGWFRYDAFYATPFQFFIINFIQLGVILTALYFIGGYDRTVEKLTLSYAAEHVLEDRQHARALARRQ